MPKRKVKRSVEEEEQFRQQRLERNAENQRRRRQNAKTIITNIVSSKTIDQRNHGICITGNIHDKRIIELNNEIVGENSTNIIPLYQQRAKYQSSYRSQKKQPRLNIDNTTLIGDIVEYYIGSMDVNCIHCNAKHFAAEKISNNGNSFHDCCNHGAVHLQLMPKFPQFLRTLFDGSPEKSNKFFKHIRSYNSSFSFASFNANLVNFQNRRSGDRFCNSSEITHFSHFHFM